MNQEDLKRRAARAALEHLVDGSVVGVGSGSTVNQFIRALGEIRHRVAGAVSSSEKSSSLLREVGIEVMGLESLDWACGDGSGRPISVYVDGADEIDPRLRMIKGGGGALTREKIVAAASRRFVCIADASKRVQRLGAFPLPIEVIPMARALIEHQIRALGGEPRLRAGFVTDNGHCIVDVHGLVIGDPVALETELNQWPGVVTVGLFARRGADVALIAEPSGQVAVCTP